MFPHGIAHPPLRSCRATPTPCDTPAPPADHRGMSVLLCEELDVSDAALSLLGRYVDAAKTAAAADPDADGALPRLYPGNGDAADGDDADPHPVLLAAGLLDVDLDALADGVRYRVTREGRARAA